MKPPNQLGTIGSESTTLHYRQTEIKQNSNIIAQIFLITRLLAGYDTSCKDIT